MNYYGVLNRLRKLIIMRRHQLFNVGAVIISRKGAPLSYGFNSYIKTHPKMLLNKNYSEGKIFVHAECDALYKLHKGESAYAIIVARIGAHNQFLLSRPCEGCWREIQSAGIKNVYYTNDNQELVLMRGGIYENLD